MGPGPHPGSIKTKQNTGPDGKGLGEGVREGEPDDPLTAVALGRVRERILYLDWVVLGEITGAVLECKSNSCSPALIVACLITASVC